MPGILPRATDKTEPLPASGDPGRPPTALRRGRADLPAGGYGRLRRRSAPIHSLTDWTVSAVQLAPATTPMITWR